MSRSFENDFEDILAVNKTVSLVRCGMHPVMSAANKVRFWVSEDETTLCLDVGEAFRGVRRGPTLGGERLTAEDKTAMIHAYVESNLPDFHKRVVCLLLKNSRHGVQGPFVIDGKRLKKSFPKLGSLCCTDSFSLTGMDDGVCVLDPFDLGEMSFYLAMDGDIPMANAFTRDLWALDSKWARFFRDVARDYYRKPERLGTKGATGHWTGMDLLFHIYLLGWYHRGEAFSDAADRVSVSGHKDLGKALALLSVRFRGCSAKEAAEKLCRDYRQVETEENPDYEVFAKVLQEAERLVPGVLAVLYDEGVLPRPI